MNVLVLGSGGREHAICKSIKESKSLKKLWCFPGNAGTNELCNKERLSNLNFESILNFCIKKKVDLVIPGSEEYLEKGITDYLNLEGIRVLGPTQAAAQLESSKIFTKKICKIANIKTAKWKLYKNASKAIKDIKFQNFPLVLKMDSLAAGKGVFIANNIKEAVTFLSNINKGLIGEKNSKILQEEVLYGEEASFFFIVDGTNAKYLGSAKDYKRVGEKNTGLNTGGMGCISPSPLDNKKTINKVLKEIITPTLKCMKKNGYPYKGILYAGLMFTKRGIYLIEYNVRLGDPECQSILSRLKTDFLKICNSIVNEKIHKLDIALDKKFSLCVVIASKGYPEKYKKNISLKILKELKLEPNFRVYHAGTKLDKNNKLISDGGRVLGLVVKKKNIKEAVTCLYEKIETVEWKNLFYRNDIGS